MSRVFVGRREQVERLETILDRARSGHAQTVLLTGDAGIGKSTLVHHMAARARAQGDLVLVGDCLQLGGIAFAAVVDALRPLADELGIDPLRRLAGEDARHLAALMPALGVAHDGDVDAALSGGGRSRLFEAVLGLLERLAARAPVVLVIEDVHWAHDSTRDLVAFLARRLDTAAVTLVLTYRRHEIGADHPMRQLLNELPRSPHVHPMDVPSFSTDELASHLEAVLASSPPRTLVDAVMARSQGNPFYAEELARADNPGTELPATLRDVLLGLFEGMPEETRALLRVAAAAGRRVHHRLLAEATGTSSEEVGEALRPAVERNVLVPDVDTGTYAFRHALLADVISGTVLPGQREAVHSRLAAALAADPALSLEAPAAELAHHWYAAGDTEAAFRSSVLAADEARGRHAYVEAREHMARVLELWNAVDDPTAVAGMPWSRALAEHAQMAFVSGANADAIVGLERAIEAHQGSDDELAMLLERLAVCLGSALQMDRMLTTTERAVALCQSDEPTSTRGRVTATHAWALWERDPAQSLALAENAIAIAEAVGDERVLAQATVLLGCSQAACGDVSAGLRNVQAGRDLAETHDLPETVGRSYVFLSTILIRSAQPEAGADEAQAGLHRVRELGIEGGWSPILAGNLLSGLFHSGRWEEATTMVDEVIGDSSGVAWLLLVHARLLAFLGRHDEADEALERARAHGGEREPRYDNVSLWLAVQRGDLDEALAVIGRRHDLVTRQHAGTVNELRAVALRAVADVAGDSPGRSTEMTALGDQLLGELTELRSGGIAHVEAWRLTAEAEHSRLRGSDPDLWDAARRVWATIDLWPSTRAYVTHRLAESLVELDRGDEAADLVTEAAAAAEALGALPLLDHVRALARRAGVRLSAPRRTGSGVAGLTTRELEVLQHVAEGFTNRQIGETLFITEKTASVHVSNILRKLDVSARTEAAAVAFRQGIVVP